MARSLGLLVIAVWLTLDLWVRLLPTTKRWKIIGGATGTSLIFIALMVIMYRWLSGVLADQRDDVLEKMSIQFDMPRELKAKQPVVASATVINGGRFEIAKHQIFCRVNFIRCDNDVTISGPNFVQPALSNVPIRGFGDGQTDNCTGGFWGLANDGALICGDITVRVEYFLATQPDFPLHKEFRVVADQKTSFVWKPEPLNFPRSFCQ